MHSEAEAKRYKRSGVNIELKDDKRSKTQESSQAQEEDDKLTAEQFSGMIYIESDVLDVDPLQSKHPVIGWEVYSDDFGDAWKIIRIRGITSICRDFEDLVRSCDREDLDTLWIIVQDQFKKDELVDVKAKELWVQFKRLYEPDASDRYWRFEANNLNTLWKFYDSRVVHHVSTQAGVDVFMLAEKEYPLRACILTVMISVKL
jgi:hypothetical protein